MCFPGCHPGSVVAHRAGGCSSAVFTCRGGEQSGLAYSYPRKGRLGSKEVQAWTFLYWGQVLGPDCVGSRYLFGFWYLAVDVP